MERAVGVFVGLAVLLLLSGFGFYLYQTALRKGWHLSKVTYYTYVNNATGLREGDPVKLMGFDAGQITSILPEKPESTNNVYVEFVILEPNFGYIWYPDSVVKVTAGDFLSKRYLEVTKGGSSGQTNLPYHATYPDAVQDGKRVVVGIWDTETQTIQPYTPDSRYYLRSEESPAVTQRMQMLADQIEQALPGFLTLTNDLIALLDHGTQAASNLNDLLEGAQPVVEDLAGITAQLEQFDGSLGRWLLSSNANTQIEYALGNANTTLAGLDTNLPMLAEKISRSLENLAGITSNLNAQVQANTNILDGISRTIIHTDELIQGLKQHWLLRSAFREKSTNTLPARPQLPGLRPPPDR